MERIGSVNLDYTFYPGEDLYCDGDVEDRLLFIAHNCNRVEFPKMIEEEKSWPVLYHLSTQRENIVDWIPMKKDAKVLEIGSGCGAITGSLARKAKSVTCVELSKKRSLINANRNMDYDNITIHVGNFKDIEPTLPDDYDYIFLIGVFEYAGSYMGTESPYKDFLNTILKHLGQDGRIIMAIENRLGLKYFAGCQEDHLGTYFSGIENYPEGGPAKTFSRRALEKIFKSCGVANYNFYYPYPDYKFMTTLYSDVYQPGPGELYNNMRNFDRDRMLLFDEKASFDSLCRDGYFPVFANSFLAVIGGILEVKYAKYSNDRAPQFQIRTEIVRGNDGQIFVRKRPITAEAAEHIRNMDLAYHMLTERYEGSGLSINKCELTDDGENPFVTFEYVQGRTLTEMLDEKLSDADMDGFLELFRKYLELVSFNESYPAADFDMAFSNILVNKDTWTLIDYEWTFGKSIATKELAFRAIYCYLLEDEQRNKLNLDLILDELGITEEEAQGFREQEMEFQKFVTGSQLSMSEMRNLIGKKIIDPMKGAHEDDSEFVKRVQIYEDCGNGFSEENSMILKDAYISSDEISFELPIKRGLQVLRIDPAFACCICKVKELSIDNKPLPAYNRHAVVSNGTTMKGVEVKENVTFVFATDDPNINIVLKNLRPEPDSILRCRMKVTRIPSEMGRDIVG